jgi:hypothetical protein
MSHQAGLSRPLHERPSGPHIPGHASGFHRARAERVQPLWPRPEPALASAVTAPTTVRPEEIRFRRLRTHEEIACVLPLRREINLHVADPAGFAVLEKKEMRAALSADSNGGDNSSDPSASFPSGRALRLAKTSSPARA